MDTVLWYLFGVGSLTLGLCFAILFVVLHVHHVLRETEDYFTEHLQAFSPYEPPTDVKRPDVIPQIFWLDRYRDKL